MKRFFSFVLFVLLLLLAVASLQLWKDRGYRGRDFRSAIDQIFRRRSDPGKSLPEKYTVADGPRINVSDVDVLAAMSRQRILLAKAVVPSVVSITTSKTVQNPSEDDDPFFRFFHRGLRRGGAATQKALGSGAIVSKEGHIVTNNHVIDQMDEIEVKLSDGRTKQATLIGTDALTDLAVLKIDADDLQPLPFGSSEAVEVGETVMAVGNPYGLNESVTQGIISAKGRRGSENISDLIQTDSVLNPGNSGGPLVNVRGELIGINDAIVSPSGSWYGVGLAIPVDTVRETMDAILKVGRVVHGYLGVYEQPGIDGAPRERLPGTPRGVRVDSVVAGSPADKADIQPGDLIQKFNRKPVGDFQDLRHSVAEVPVDTNVPVELLRNGKQLNLTARIVERPTPAKSSQGSPFVPPGAPVLPPSVPNPHGNGLIPGEDSDSLNGVQVVALDPELLQKLDLPQGTTGVFVKRIEPATVAADKLQPGDVILQINQQPVTSLAVYGKLVRSLADKQPVVLTVLRERSKMFVVLAGE